MILYLLVIAHLIADFVLQSSKMSDEKENDMSKLLMHSLLYALIFGIVIGICVGKSSGVYLFLTIVVTHFAIDWARIKFNKKADERQKLILFFLDQVLHIAVILTYYFAFDLQSGIGTVLMLIITKLGANSVYNAILYVLIYLIILHPSAVVIKRVISYISVESETLLETQYSNSTGYLIGILERIIIVTLVLQGELAAIGFVLTAKSLARFKQLEDRNFAEKYLVGTLISAAIAIIITLIFKNLFI